MQGPEQVNLRDYLKDPLARAALKANLRSHLRNATSPEEKAAIHSHLGTIDYEELKATRAPKIMHKKAAKTSKSFNRILALTNNDLPKAWAHYSLVRIAQRSDQEAPQQSMTHVLTYVLDNCPHNEDATNLLLSSARSSFVDGKPVITVQLLDKLQKVLQTPSITHQQWIKAFRRDYALLEQTHPQLTFMDRLKLTGVNVKTLSDALCNSIEEHLARKPSIDLMILLIEHNYRKKTIESLLTALDQINQANKKDDLLTAIDQLKKAREGEDFVATVDQLNQADQNVTNKLELFYRAVCVHLEILRSTKLENNERLTRLGNLLTLTNIILLHSTNRLLKWKALLHKVQILYLVGTSDALKTATSAVILIKTKCPNKKIVCSALCLSYQKLYTEAQITPAELCEQLVLAKEIAHLTEKPTLKASGYDEISRLYQPISDWANVLKYAQKALEIKETTFSNDRRINILQRCRYAYMALLKSNLSTPTKKYYRQKINELSKEITKLEQA